MVKKSKTNGAVIGTIKEFNLKREDDVTGLKAWSQQDGAMKELSTCSRFVKEKFGNPALVISVDGIDFPVDFDFDVKEKSFDNEGKEQTDYAFNGLNAVMNEYVMGQTRVRVSVGFDHGEYAGTETKDSDDVVWITGTPKLTYKSISSTNVPAEDSVQVDVTGKILKISPVTVDGAETGDLAVYFGLVSGTKAEPFAYKITTIMDKEVKYIDAETGKECSFTADDFAENFEVGASTSLSFEVRGEVVASAPAEKKGFGKGTVASQRKTGRAKFTYHIVGGCPLAVNDDNAISDDEWKSLEEERAKIIPVKIQKRIEAIEKKKTQNGGSTVKGSAQTAIGQLPFSAVGTGDEIPFI